MLSFGFSVFVFAVMLGVAALSPVSFGGGLGFILFGHYFGRLKGVIADADQSGCLGGNDSNAREEARFTCE